MDRKIRLTMYLPAPDVPHLTGLRAVAAIMVMLLHLDFVYGSVISRHLPPVDQGYLGVDIFFVLSGFILSHVYTQSPEPMSFWAFGLFLWRRFARLYPVHIFTLVGLVAMVSARGLLNTNLWDVYDLPRHLFLMQAWTNSLTWNTPAWSISAEWAAYSLFPVFVALVLRTARLSFGILFVAALLCGFQFFVLRDTTIAWAFMGWPAFLRVMTEFSIGMLGFRIARSIAPSTKFDIISCCAFGALFFVPFELIKIITIGIFVPSIALSKSIVRSVLASKVVVAVGVVSYSIYMIHFPVIKLIQNFNYRFDLEKPSALFGLLLTIIWAIIIILLAGAMYFAIERPLRNWCRGREQKLFGRF